MNKKVSFYNIYILLFSLIITTIFLYQIFIRGNENITFFILIIFAVIFTFFNAVYVGNMKKSIIELFNLKKKKVYNRIFIEGMICYSPILVSVIVYSFLNYKLFLVIGLVNILGIVLDILVLNNVNKNSYYIGVFTVELMVSVLFFMRGMAYVVKA